MQARPAKSSTLHGLLMTLALSCPCFLSSGCTKNGYSNYCGGESTSVTKDSFGNFSFSQNVQNRKINLKSNGALTINETENDVALLSPGGQFSLNELNGEQTREYIVTSKSNGVLVRVFRVNGQDREIDEEAQEWIYDAFVHVFRNSGFDLKNRVSRILVTGGANALLEEIRQIKGEYALAEYLKESLLVANFDDVQFSHWIECLSGLRSDFERKRSLSFALECTETLSAVRFNQLLSASEQIHGDFERSEFLLLALKYWPKAGDRDAWFKSLAGISSDFETARALKQAIQSKHGEPHWLDKIATHAGQHIHSSFELCSVLQGVCAAPVNLPKSTLEAVLSSVDRINSPFEKSSMLRQVALHIGDDLELKARATSIAAPLPDSEREQVWKMFKTTP